MASEEISSNPQGCSNSSWMIQVGYDRIMKEEDIPDIDEAGIFRMSRSLPDSEHLYSPRFVSIGPFHYGKEKLKAMEKSKDEAVRRMQIRIEMNDPSASIKSFVEQHLLLKDKEIRKFYGEDIDFTPKKLAWIVARDACFVFEFLVNYMSWYDTGMAFYENEVKSFLWSFDAVFDVAFQNPMREGLMEDILLLENQIPLWVLKDILQIQMGSPKAGDEKLKALLASLLMCATRHCIFMWLMNHSYTNRSHILEVVYCGMLGENVQIYDDLKAVQLPPSRKQIYFERGVDLMNAVCAHWFMVCLCFPFSNTSPENAQRTPSSPQNCMQIWLKNGVDSMKAICDRWCKMCLGLLSSNISPSNVVKLDFLKLPTALELTRAGVKIHPVTHENGSRETFSGIQWIRFDEKTATLYLPEIRVTPQLYSVINNMIAMEVSTRMRYHPRPMAQYVLFMDELMDSEEDVAVLRKAEVINNFLGSNKQLADIFNSLGTGIIPALGCNVIFEARSGLHRYMKKKYKILWSEFVNAYLSKPWLVAGSTAAVLLLLMTMSQVLCLFFTCNP